MDSKEKMLEAMKAIQEACNMNTAWADCDKCPFRVYCDAIEQNDLQIPASLKFIQN